jgi:hypothetical protein
VNWVYRFNDVALKELKKLGAQRSKALLLILIPEYLAPKIRAVSAKG